MGRDKAFVEVRGRPLAGIARDALVDAGADEVLAVGGDGDRLAALGFRAVPDRLPGEGPLAALATALDAAQHEIVVVLACDLPSVTGDAVTAVLAALGDAEAAVPDIAGGPQVLLAAYRRRCLPALEQALADGERAVRPVVARLAVASVALADPGWAHNANRPEDLS
jgi:molybdopterin-guanine dinucleotide biosynthesis protein A